MRGRAVFDIRLNPSNNELYISGDSIAAIQSLVYSCPLFNIQFSSLCAGNRTIATISAADSGAYSFHWSDSLGTVLRSVNNTRLMHDTITGLVGGRTYTLTVEEIQHCNTDTFYVCPGQVIRIGSHNYSAVGTYHDTLRGAYCDSIIISTLIRNPATSITSTYSLCRGDSILIRGRTYHSVGTYYDSLHTLLGCDSILVTVINAAPAIVINLNLRKCIRDTIHIAGSNYSIAGIYRDTLRSYRGCDSILVLNIANIANALDTINSGICSGDSVFIVGRYFYLPGYYHDTLRSYLGCDSILTVHIHALAADSAHQRVQICSSSSYSVAGHTYTVPGLYVDTLRNCLGCDSILFTNLTVSNVLIDTIRRNGCIGIQVHVGPHTYTSSGVYTDTLHLGVGCDSVVITYLQVRDSSSFTLDTAICAGASLLVNHVAISHDTSADITLLNYAGCDSFFHLRVKVNALPFISAGQDTDAFLGDPISLQAIGTYFTHWSTGASTRSIIYQAISDSYFIAYALDSNGCVASDTILVSVSDNAFLKVPQAFSPNADGHNDYFTVFGKGISFYQISIYNRWGELIYKAANLSDLNNLNAGWDGTYKGTAQPLGTYVYVIDYRTLNSSEQKMLKGNLEVVR
jgi:gliding motility-associated-like protein